MRYHPDNDGRLKTSEETITWLWISLYLLCLLQHEGGYGFAEFDDREDAKDAVKVLSAFVLLTFNVLQCAMLCFHIVVPDVKPCSGFGRDQFHGKQVED